jgi:NAD(P)H-dependent flavin oxidoreductase YrpB (nitropropane dioxygenase family)
VADQGGPRPPAPGCRTLLTRPRAQWKRISGGRPFVLKGIQSAADATRAADIGCDGIVVTNHAGRQVDGAVGSLEVLPEIVDAVGTRVKIIFDSGVRTGADVFKALALGAHVVEVGRLYIWGMSHEGEYGCRHVMKSLLAVSRARKLALSAAADEALGPGHPHDRRGLPDAERYHARRAPLQRVGRAAAEG